MIVVVDYGMGNIRSVSKAFETAGAQVEVTGDPQVIAGAEAVVLPGVGAFARGMENLRKLNVIPTIYEMVEKKVPVFGICLGLQLLFTESEEHGICKGLGLVKGRVRKFTSNVKIPHMGWNQIKLRNPNPPGGQEKSHIEIFDGITDNSYFYFVHSYYVEPEDRNIVIATTEYDKDFVSAINKDNVWGVQFHPEKSDKSGLKILRNFCANRGRS